MTGGVPRRVWGGTGLLVLGRLWGSACTLTYLYLLAQHLDQAGFGRLTFYLALFLVLDNLVDLGTGQAAVQRTAGDATLLSGVLGAARRIRLVTGLLGVLLVGGGAWLAGEPDAGWIALASLYPVTHALELSTLVFKNRIAWSRPVLVRAIAAGASLSCVFLFRALGATQPGPFLVAIALGSTLGNALLFFVSRPHLPRAPFLFADPKGTGRVRPLFLLAFPMGLASLCQQAYFYIDNLFVRAWVGVVPLGHYNVAVRFMSYGIMLAVFASLAALPWLTREHAAGRLGSAALRLARPSLCAASLAVGLVWPYCAALLALFGEGFEGAAPALRWLLLAVLAVYLGAPLVTSVVATGRSRALLVISASGLATNIGLNALWVPAHGLAGAAAATLATELLVALGAALSLLRSGASFRGSGRAWTWLAVPAAFGAGRVLAALLPW